MQTFKCGRAGSVFFEIQLTDLDGATEFHGSHSEDLTALITQQVEIKRNKQTSTRLMVKPGQSEGDVEIWIPNLL